MRNLSRSLTVLVVLGVAACTEAGPTSPAVDVPGPSFAKVNNVHQARGSGHITATGARRTFAFTAHLNADGSASGNSTLVFHQSIYNSENANLTKQDLEITCMSVSGNQAWVGGIIRNSTIPGADGLQSSFTVIDGGEGKDAAPDQVSLQGIGSAAPDFAQSYCDAQPAQAMFPVEDGNVQVN